MCEYLGQLHVSIPCLLRCCGSTAELCWIILHAYTGSSEEDSGAEKGREGAGCPIEVIMRMNIIIYNHNH